MKLSDLSADFPEIHVVRDAAFDSLGMASSSFEQGEVLSFLADEKFIKSVCQNSRISALLISPNLARSPDLPDRMGIAVTASPKNCFYEIHNHLAAGHFYWQPFENEIDPTACISPLAQLPEHSCRVGAHTTIEAGVHIFSGSRIGAHCTIGAGSVIGGSGFQFLNDGDRVLAVQSAGQIRLDDYVEVQYNSCVDRGVFGGTTHIGEYCKIDNLVYIAHDVVLGPRTLVAASSAIGGRTVIGADCWLGLNVSIANGLRISDHVAVSMGAVVTQDVASGLRVSGNFALEHGKFLDHLRKIR